jgi:hypothetical protein
MLISLRKIAKFLKLPNLSGRMVVGSSNYLFVKFSSVAIIGSILALLCLVHLWQRSTDTDDSGARFKNALEMYSKSLDRDDNGDCGDNGATDQCDH